MLANFLTIERSFLTTMESLDPNARPSPSTLSPVPSITTTATSDGGNASTGNKLLESLEINDSIDSNLTTEARFQTKEIVTVKISPLSSQESHV